MFVLTVQNLISYLDFRCGIKGNTVPKSLQALRHSNSRHDNKAPIICLHFFVIPVSFCFLFSGQKRRYNRPIPDTLPPSMGLLGEDVCTLLLGGCHAGIAWTGLLGSVKICDAGAEPPQKMSKHSNNILILTQPQPQPQPSSRRATAATTTTRMWQCRLFRSTTKFQCLDLQLDMLLRLLLFYERFVLDPGQLLLCQRILGCLCIASPRSRR